ncbi:MAG: PLD nuclease N-terminal domain-containing protein [Anaerolineae bacterium]
MDQVGVQELLKYLPFIVPLVVIQLGLMLYALLDLVRRERAKHLPKWLWALIVLFGQLLGPLAYLILGRED